MGSTRLASVAILLGAALVVALIIFPSRAFRRAPGPFSRNRVRVGELLRSPGSETDVCALAKGNWCVDWSQPSSRKRTFAWPAGTGPLRAYNKSCLWNDACNNVGVCDRTTGKCRCRAGWQGDDCSERQDRPCSQNTRPRGSFKPDDRPFDFHGRWMASMCAGECDLDYGACFCPRWTKYGRVANMDQRDQPTKFGRPMGLNCQPRPSDEGDEGDEGDGKESEVGTIPYQDVLGPEGWCQSDTPKTRCACFESGDGLAGRFCDIPVEHMCTGQLNGKGTCRNGFFQCNEGWTGQDCSIEVSKLSLQKTPGDGGDPHAKGTKGTVKLVDTYRDRPLIYVYDLPPLFNARMHEYKLGAAHCVHRLFDDLNETQWVHQGQYALESGLHELMLESSHRTLDPEEADFFYIPVYPACYMMPVHGYADTPNFHTAPGDSRRVVAATNMLLEALHFIRTHHPYWDRKSGSDHILLNVHDEGSCWIPEALKAATILSHWGYTGRRRFSSYEPDKWDFETIDPIYMPEGYLHKLGNQPCFDPKKDIVVPTMFPFEVKFPSTPWLGGRVEKDILGMHLGRSLDHLPEYSNGTRQALGRMVREKKWWDKHRIFVGDKADLPKLISKRSYSDLLARSIFCFVMMGEGWSSRMEEAIAHLCVPVILIENTVMPFEPYINVKAFSIRVQLSDMERLPEILEEHLPSVPTYQESIAKVHSRFEWKYSRFKASERLPEKFKRAHLQPLSPDAPDAFDTLLAILHERTQ